MSWFFGSSAPSRKAPSAVDEISANRDTLKQRLDLTMAQQQASRAQAEHVGRRGDRASALIHLQMARAKAAEADQISALVARAERNIAALQMHALTAMVVKDSKMAVANLTKDRKLTADAAADVSDLLEDATEDSTEVSEAIGIRATADVKDELEAELDALLQADGAAVASPAPQPGVPAVPVSELPEPCDGMPPVPTSDPRSRTRRALVTNWLEND